MTTLAKDTYRAYELGVVNQIPVIAADIIYEGAAVGIVAASGHARPLTSVDAFAGFAEQKADNSSGAAADINVYIKKKGAVPLAVSGAVSTDLNQPVYATDDDTFTFLPTGAVFIGFVRRFVSAGVVVVEYDAGNYADPYGGGVYETFSAAATLTVLDTGKTFFVDTDAQTMTLLTYAAATGIHIKVVTMGAYGTVGTTIDPAALDKISGPDATGADGGIMTNTKATAQRGDYVELASGGDDGYMVVAKKGIWTIA